MLTGYPSKDRPWLMHYPQELLENRKRSLKNNKITERLREVWQDKTEVILTYCDENISVEDFFKRITLITGSLREIGVRENDVIFASLESVPEYVELLLAVETIGGLLRNYLGNVDEIVKLINEEKRIQYLFVPDYFSEDDIKEIYKNTNIKNIITIDPLFSVTDKENVRPNIIHDIKGRYKGEKSQNSNNISFDVFLKMGEALTDIVPVQGDHSLFSAFTSGTSGKPKEVLHSSESTLGIIDQMALFPSHNKEKDSWLLTILPPSLVVVVIAMILYPLADGKRLILDPYCRIEDLDIEMMHYEPSCWALIPMFFNILLESERIPNDYDMSYFKLFGFGAEPMNKKFVEKVQLFLDKHHCKAPFSSGYGQSEGGSDFTIAMGKDMLASGSAGIPLIDTIISIFKPNTCEELTYCQIGEICKTGPGLMLGYMDSDQTEKVLKKHPDGRLWLHTGDYGYITEQGILFVLGMDKEHAGFEKPYLFLVAEKGVSQEKILDNVNGFIAEELLEEERPKEIFFIDKRPIYKFKTDRRLLQKEYGLID